MSTVPIISFVGAGRGRWRVSSMVTICGVPLPKVAAIEVQEGLLAAPPSGWSLSGAISNLRYATQAEVVALKSVQPVLDRPEAMCAALIPIKKTAAWWALAQDERRAIFEETSHHTAIGLEYLPAVARRLHHCRDLGAQPFDFLTWFEFAPEHEVAFDSLVQRLRATREWDFVEREVDIRLLRT